MIWIVIGLYVVKYCDNSDVNVDYVNQHFLYMNKIDTTYHVSWESLIIDIYSSSYRREVATTDYVTIEHQQPSGWILKGVPVVSQNQDEQAKSLQ